jgi:hypothetical protein
MNGQWIGSYSGTNSGALMVEMDDLGSHFEGRAYAFDSNPELPSTSAFIRTVDKSNKFKLNIGLAPLHKHSSEILDWEVVRKDYPADVVAPTNAETDWDWNDSRILIKWNTNIGTSGAAPWIPDAASGLDAFSFHRCIFRIQKS